MVFPTLPVQLALFTLFFAGCTRGVIPDNQMSAVEAHDYTALIQGCGVQISDGFLVCRKTEGEIANDSLTFLAPPVHCKKSGSCVTFKIFFADGSPTYGGEIPRGETRVNVPWSTLLHRSTFELGDRGFWGFSYRITYTDHEGHEREAYSQGEIYLRVIKQGYTSLHNIESDPAQVWSWIEGNKTIKLTTGMRTSFKGCK